MQKQVESFQISPVKSRNFCNIDPLLCISLSGRHAPYGNLWKCFGDIYLEDLAAGLLLPLIIIWSDSLAFLYVKAWDLFILRVDSHLSWCSLWNMGPLP